MVVRVDGSRQTCRMIAGWMYVSASVTVGPGTVATVARTVACQSGDTMLIQVTGGR